MSRVFVVQEVPGRNLLPIKKFGDAVILLPYNAQIVFSSGPVVRQLRERLKGFDDSDFILAMGDPAAIGLTCDIASQFNNHKYKMLKWDRQEHQYYIVTFDTGPQSPVTA